MGEKYDDLTKTDFIFGSSFSETWSYHKINNLLHENVGSYDLWYYCMEYLRIMNEKNVHTKMQDQCDKKYILSSHINKISSIKPSFFGWFFPSKNLNDDNNKDLDILFISRDRFIETKIDNKLIKSDYLFYGTIQTIQNRLPNTQMGLLCDTTPPGDLNIAAYNIYGCIKPLHIIRSCIFTIRKKIQWKYYSNSLIRNRKKYSEQHSLTLARLDSFFSFIVLFTRCLQDHSYSHIFRRLNPKIIITNDDILQLKPIFDHDIKFITVQSASMSPESENYRHEFISKFGTDSIKSDYFICTGEYFKELKEYSNVSKKVVAMGQPRYDIIANAKKTYNKSKIIMDNGLDPNKKIILWCTQTHGMSFDENISNINAVFSTMTHLKETSQLVIKLHPGEDQKAPLYHQNIHYDPIILKKEVDTNALLYSCDLMITKNSTTAMEAVILNKPVIILNLSGDPDQTNYVSEGVALGVYDPARLSYAIKTLLDDNSRLDEKREEFIEKYLYKVDGKATERIVNLIASLLAETKP